MKPKDFEECVQRLERSGFPIDKRFAKAIRKLLVKTENQEQIISRMKKALEEIPEHDHTPDLECGTPKSIAFEALADVEEMGG